MSQEIFDKALFWVKNFAQRRTQKELNLFGVGEPTLHPKLFEYIDAAKRVIPIAQKVHINTNGKTMTYDMAKELKSLGCEVDLTAHNTIDAAHCERIFQDVNLPHRISIDFIIQPNDWAGQVKWYKSRVRYTCPWIARGQVMVMSDGSLSTCCFDAFAKGVLGHVSDDDVPDIDVVPFELCKACHQIAR